MTTLPNAHTTAEEWYNMLEEGREGGREGREGGRERGKGGREGGREREERGRGQSQPRTFTGLGSHPFSSVIPSISQNVT